MCESTCVTACILPSRPVRAIVLPHGIVVPVRVRDKRVYCSPRFRQLTSCNVVDYSLGFEARIMQDIIYRYPTKLKEMVKPFIEPRMWNYKLPYTVRYVVLEDHSKLVKVSPRTIYYKLREKAIPLDKPVNLYDIEKELKYYNGAYYISRKKIINLAGYRGFENANYMVLMRNYVVLLA